VGASHCGPAKDPPRERIPLVDAGGLVLGSFVVLVRLDGSGVRGTVPRAVYAAVEAKQVKGNLGWYLDQRAGRPYLNYERPGRAE